MSRREERAKAWMREHLNNGCTREEAARWVTRAEAEHPNYSPAWWARVAELKAMDLS